MTQEKLAYSIKTFCEAAEVGRSFAYGEIAAGRLKAVKVGRRTLIPAHSAREWLRRLESEAA